LQNFLDIVPGRHRQKLRPTRKTGWKQCACISR